MRLQEQISVVVTAVHSVGQQGILEQQLNEAVLTIQNAALGIKRVREERGR